MALVGTSLHHLVISQQNHSCDGGGHAPPPRSVPRASHTENVSDGPPRVLIIKIIMRFYIHEAKNNYLLRTLVNGMSKSKSLGLISLILKKFVRPGEEILSLIK